MVDCNDNDPTINPMAEEICDNADNDCDPVSADGSEDPLYGVACDGNDSDLCLEGTNSCSDGSIVCSDNTSDTLEVCGDEIDNDCDGEVDEGCPSELCGNNIIDLGEVCDGSALDGVTCMELGFIEGFLGCTATCDAYDLSGCIECIDCNDYNKQACNDGVCGPCATSTDCCAPFECIDSTCVPPPG